MTLRSPSEKLESNAIKKFKTGKLLPNWPHLAANPLACSGRKWGGLIWPQLLWLVLAATQMALCGRKFTAGLANTRNSAQIVQLFVYNSQIAELQSWCILKMLTTFS